MLQPKIYKIYIEPPSPRTRVFHKQGYWVSFPANNNSRSLITVSQTTTFKMTSNNKRGSGDGGPPPKRPPDPPDELERAMTARVNANLPPLQCLLQFMNRDPGTLCYAGSGCNLLCCAPTMTQFLGRLPPSQGLPNMVRLLALRAPNQVDECSSMLSSLSFHSQPIQPKAIRNRLIQEVPAVEGFSDEARHHDAQEWVTNLMDAVGNLLPLEQGQRWRQLYSIGITADYVCDGPDHHRVIKAPSMKGVLSVPVMDADKRPIRNINDAIEEELSLQWIERRCDQDNCNSKWSAEHSTITLCPEVSIAMNICIPIHCIAFHRFSSFTTSASSQSSGVTKSSVSSSNIQLRPSPSSISRARSMTWWASWYIRVSQPTVATTTLTLSVLRTPQHSEPTGATMMTRLSSSQWRPS